MRSGLRWLLALALFLRSAAGWAETHWAVVVIEPAGGKVAVLGKHQAILENRLQEGGAAVVHAGTWLANGQVPGVDRSQAPFADMTSVDNFLSVATKAYFDGDVEKAGNDLENARLLPDPWPAEEKVRLCYWTAAVALSKGESGKAQDQVDRALKIDPDATGVEPNVYPPALVALVQSRRQSIHPVRVPAVQVWPPDSTIYLDGRKLPSGGTSTATYLPDQPHSWIVAHPGFRTWRSSQPSPGRVALPVALDAGEVSTLVNALEDPVSLGNFAKQAQVEGLVLVVEGHPTPDRLEVRVWKEGTIHKYPGTVEQPPFREIEADVLGRPVGGAGGGPSSLVAWLGAGQAGRLRNESILSQPFWFGAGAGVEAAVEYQTPRILAYLSGGYDNYDLGQNDVKVTVYGDPACSQTSPCTVTGGAAYHVTAAVGRRFGESDTLAFDLVAGVAFEAYQLAPLPSDGAAIAFPGYTSRVAPQVSGTLRHPIGDYSAFAGLTLTPLSFVTLAPFPSGANVTGSAGEPAWAAGIRLGAVHPIGRLLLRAEWSAEYRSFPLSLSYTPSNPSNAPLPDSFTELPESFIVSIGYPFGREGRP